ncbi:MAG: DNA mismatch repair endonuclease MutL [Clostridium sp.]
MPDIIQLDELTINQIAAGEVIERPSSVVKELVENSIDAGATNITVEVTKGGIESIKIVDDGCGIKQEDIGMAFERHATSKIRTAKDLETVTSMGFRGEALASVAAIAEVEMITKCENEIGTRIIIKAGKIQKIEPVAAPKGTTITVTNLFFNTPVRYKFLKKDYTEVGYIDEIIRNLALINRHISFKLINNGKQLVKTTGTNDSKNVIYSLYDEDIANNIVEVEFGDDEYKISGLVGKPDIARSNRKNQIFFVNGRSIKDRLLYSAVEKAYKGMIPIGRFGFCILNIQIPPKDVDVNVHPAKLEVRFSHEQRVFKLIYETILKALNSTDLTSSTQKADFKIASDVLLELDERTNIELNENKKEYLKINRNEELDNQDDKNKTNIDEILKEEQKRLDSEKENENTKDSEFLKLKNQMQNFDINNVDIKNKPNIDDIINKYKEKHGAPQEVLKQIDNQNTEENLENNSENEEDNKLKVPEEEALFGNINFVEDEENENTDINSNAVRTQQIQERAELLRNKKEEMDLEKEKIKEKIIQAKEGKPITEVELELEEESKQEEKQQNVNFDSMYEKAFGTEVLEKKLERRRQEEEISINKEMRKATSATLFKNGKAPYKVIGVLFKTYIIIEFREEMYIIDQHAAHERVLYEKVKANYYENADKNMQQLLMPDVITLSYKEFELAKNNREIFQKAGFEFDEFGINKIRLNAVPAMCEILNTRELFLDILDEIDGAPTSGRQAIEERFLATVACKAAVKANMALSEIEIKSLLDEIFKLPNPFTCPHGRPTAIKMTKYDIERKFSRK